MALRRKRSAPQAGSQEISGGGNQGRINGYEDGGGEGWGGRSLTPRTARRKDPLCRSRARASRTRPDASAGSSISSAWSSASSRIAAVSLTSRPVGGSSRGPGRGGLRTGEGLVLGSSAAAGHFPLFALHGTSSAY